MLIHYSPLVYQRVNIGLLTSPHYGERRIQLFGKAIN